MWLKILNMGPVIDLVILATVRPIVAFLSYNRSYKLVGRTGGVFFYDVMHDLSLFFSIHASTQV